MADKGRIVILADGTIRTEFGRVSGVNHQSAEEFLRGVTVLTGGESTRAKLGHGHAHDHNHAHDHDHNHQ